MHSILWCQILLRGEKFRIWNFPHGNFPSILWNHLWNLTVVAIYHWILILNDKYSNLWLDIDDWWLSIGWQMISSWYNWYIDIWWLSIGWQMISNWYDTVLHGAYHWYVNIPKLRVEYQYVNNQKPRVECQYSKAKSWISIIQSQELNINMSIIQKPRDECQYSIAFTNTSS